MSHHLWGFFSISPVDAGTNLDKIVLDLIHTHTQTQVTPGNTMGGLYQYRCPACGLLRFYTMLVPPGAKLTHKGTCCCFLELHVNLLLRP